MTRNYTCKWRKVTKVCYPEILEEGQEEGEGKTIKLVYLSVFITDSAPVCDSGRYLLTYSSRSSQYILKIVPRVNVGDKIHYEYKIDKSDDPKAYKFDCYMDRSECMKFIGSRFAPNEALTVFMALHC